MNQDNWHCQRCGSDTGMMFGSTVTLIGDVPANLCTACRRDFSDYMAEHETAVSYELARALVGRAQMQGTDRDVAASMDVLQRAALAIRAVSIRWLDEEVAK